MFQNDGKIGGNLFKRTHCDPCEPHGELARVAETCCESSRCNRSAWRLETLAIVVACDRQKQLLYTSARKRAFSSPLGSLACEHGNCLSEARERFSGTGASTGLFASASLYKTLYLQRPSLLIPVRFKLPASKHRHRRLTLRSV